MTVRLSLAGFSELTPGAAWFQEKKQRSLERKNPPHPKARRETNHDGSRSIQCALGLHPCIALPSPRTLKTMNPP